MACRCCRCGGWGPVDGKATSALSNGHVHAMLSVCRQVRATLLSLKHAAAVATDLMLKHAHDHWSHQTLRTCLTSNLLYCVLPVDACRQLCQLATSPTALCAAPKWGSGSVLHRPYGAYQHSVQHHNQLAHVCGALAVTSIFALLPCYPYMHHQPRWCMQAKHRRSSVNQCGKYRTSLCFCFPAYDVNLNMS